MSATQPFPVVQMAETAAEALSPPSPPEPDALSASDAQPSRKREREVSLEPGAPPVTSADPQSANKDRQTAKKNRLDTTEEEGDSEASPHLPGTPIPARTRSSTRTGEVISAPDVALSMSPPHEVKMRHISRRVEHINWKNGESQAASPELPPATGGSTPEDEGTRSPRRQSMESIRSAGGSKRSRDEADDGGDARSSKRPSPPADAEPDLEPTQEPTQPPTQETQQEDKDMEDQLAKRRSMDSILSVGGTKRPRDETDTDTNPREIKRPSPPPDKKEEKPKDTAPVATASPKLGGFASYASFTSPFASATSKPVFGSSSSGPSSSFATPSASPSPFGSNGTASKSSGFAAFAGAASPFTPNKRAKSPDPGRERPNSPGRSKSPLGRAGSQPSFGTSLERPSSPARAPAPSFTATRANPNMVASAFSSYAVSSGFPSAFSAPAAKPAWSATPLAAAASEQKASQEDGDSDDSEKKTNGLAVKGQECESSFSARLRSEKDEQTGAEDGSKLELSEQELHTGEEDEETVYQVRGKLYVLSDSNQWKERGTGSLRLNVRRVDGHGARLVMRKEAVYTVILNITLFKGMSCVIAQDPRYIRFSAIEDGKTTHYNLRVSNAKIAQELLNEIQINSPTA